MPLYHASRLRQSLYPIFRILSQITLPAPNSKIVTQTMLQPFKRTPGSMLSTHRCEFNLAPNYNEAEGMVQDFSPSGCIYGTACVAMNRFMTKLQKTT